MKFLLSTAELIISLVGICLVTQGKSAETKNILYYGWFFDPETAGSLQTISNSCFNEYLKNPIFESFIESAVRNSNLTSPQEYFTKPLDPNTGEFDPLYHVTAKFCGGSNTCSPYSDLEEVAKSTGKLFTMELIGWFFTNRTYGFRVHLSDEQENLYKPDGETNLKRMHIENVPTTKTVTYQNYSGIEFEDQELNLAPSKSKAHITFGCAPGIPAQITGDDLGDIVKLEWDTNVKKENISLEDALMVHYDAEWEAFVVYPNRKIKAKATFRPYYSVGNKTIYSATIFFSLTISIICFYLCY